MIRGRLLGIDHGIKRIGLAVSDASGLLATELTIIQRKSKAEDFAKLNQIIQHEGVIALVVGVPMGDTSESGYTQADTVRLWMQRFAETHTLPMIEWDEELTSDEAQSISYLKGRRARDPIDDIAAQIILQSYLDAVREGRAVFPTPAE